MRLKHLLLALLAMLTTLGAAYPVEARGPRKGETACGGRDLIAELRAQGPEVGQRLDATAAGMSNAKAILWRLEKDGAPASHLFGTVHVTDDRVNDLTPAIQAAIDGARVMALEIADLSPEKLGAGIAKVATLLQYPDGRSLEALLAKDELEIARGALEKAGMPGAALAKLRPWVVTMAMALTDCERGRAAAGLKPLDERLGIRARERRMEVVSLESVEGQLRAMAAIPEVDQLALLKAGLRLNHRAQDMMETLVGRYLASDLGMIWAMQIELWRQNGVDEAAAGSFMRELVALRNQRMRDAALPHLAKGNVFVAVGALHLPGKDGLVALFQEAGYTVTPVE